MYKLSGTKLLFILITLFFIGCKPNQTSTNISPENDAQDNATISTNNRLNQLNEEIMKGEKDSDLYYQRAQEYAEMEQYEHAMSDMFVAFKLDSLNKDYYIFGTDLLLKTAQSANAVSLMKKANSLIPNDAELKLKYAELLITLNQLEEAIREIDGVLYRDTQNPKAFFLMGYIMTLIEEDRKAKVALQRAVELDPEIMDAYLMLSELYEDTKPDLALQYLENAILVAPDAPEPYHNKAYFLQNNNQIPEALAIYDKMKVRFPQYGSAFLNSGILYIEIDSLDLAYDNFNILTRINPESHLAYFYRGYTQELKGNVEEARKDYKQSLILKPDYEKAKKQLSQL